MQGKEDDKVEGFLNLKDLRRQTTANEEKFVISASANGNNQSGKSSTPECSSLISVMRQKALLTFLVTIKKPCIFNHISLMSRLQLHVFTNRSKFVSGKHDCHTSRSKTTEVVTEQSHEIKMYIKTTNFKHKLSLQERIQNLCIFLCSQSCLWFRTKKEVKLSEEGWLYPVNYQHSLYLMVSKPIWFPSPSNYWSPY